MSDDTQLRERFASLRKEEAGRAPPFTQVLQRAPPSSFWKRGPLAAIACLAAITVTLLLFPHAHTPPLDPAAASLADWRSPMDFLLNTPSQEMLRTIPAIGAPSPGILDAYPRLKDTTPARRAGREHS